MYDKFLHMTNIARQNALKEKRMNDMVIFYERSARYRREILSML